MHIPAENADDDVVAPARTVSACGDRMLVIGGVELARDTVAALGQRIDMAVELAEDDRVASIMATLSLVEARPYAVVLADVQMAKGCGLDAVAWLRSNGWQVPVIGIGTDISDDERKRLLAAGCDDVVERPINAERLKTVFKRLAIHASEETRSPSPEVNAAPADGSCETPAEEPEPVASVLPATVSTKAPSEPARKPVAADVASAAQDSGKPQPRVLVVEDAVCMQDIVSRFLEKMGIDVDRADNGEVACQMAMDSHVDGRPYDVILMDIQMPKMNGKQATKWLRENGWQGPIVALTGHSTAKDHAAILTVGCTAFVDKPITKTSLEKALAQFVHHD